MKLHYSKCRQLHLYFALLKWRLGKYLGLSEVLVLDGGTSGESISSSVPYLKYYGFGRKSSVILMRKLGFLVRIFSRCAVVINDDLISRFSPLVPGIFYIQPKSDPKAAWHLCRIAEVCLHTNALGRSEKMRRVVRMLETLGKLGHEKAYLFGTGPSLGTASGRFWEDGYRIVCNTIVKDQDLWGHLKPHVIAAGDGLYHFGHTAHARQFRTDLKRRLAEFPAYFVYPDRFECLVMEEFREFDRWLVPMPQRRGVETHRSVREKASLPAGIGNVLCALLLPLGCALARDVQLLGFDGRRKTDQGFWSYSNAHAYPELIEELKKEFPAFFEENIPKRDPEKYIRQVHGDSLERVLLGAEKAGYRFTLLSPSTTETLQRRYKGEFLIDGTRMESSEVPNTPNMGQIQDQSGINGLRKLS